MIITGHLHIIFYLISLWVLEVLFVVLLKLCSEISSDEKQLFVRRGCWQDNNGRTVGEAFQRAAEVHLL